jgi:SAM-dependent methyltransferase
MPLHAFPRSGLKLNLGAGDRKYEGYINVDSQPATDPDLLWDLERFPWPFHDSSVDHVLMLHVLEHVGSDPDTFLGVMRELYRVCRDGARVVIKVPHPSHDDYLADPTHVRPVSFRLLQKFDRALNLQWKAENKADTPFALRTGVDFRFEDPFVVLDDRAVAIAVERGVVQAEESKDLTKMLELSRIYRNLVKQLEVKLVVRK